MYCMQCGTLISDSDKFCPTCGAAVAAPESTASLVSVPPVEKSGEEPVIENADPVFDNGFSKALTLMIFAIVGATFGSYPYTALIGLVFSAIARGMVGRFRSAGYQIGPQGLHRKARVSGIFAKVGNIVSIVGLIVSIVMFIVSLCIFIAFLVAAVSKKH